MPQIRIIPFFKDVYNKTKKVTDPEEAENNYWMKQDIKMWMEMDF